MIINTQASITKVIVNFPLESILPELPGLLKAIILNVLDKNDSISDTAYTLLNLLQQTFDEYSFFEALLSMISDAGPSMPIKECTIEVLHIFLRDSETYIQSVEHVSTVIQVLRQLIMLRETARGTIIRTAWDWLACWEEI